MGRDNETLWEYVAVVFCEDVGNVMTKYQIWRSLRWSSAKGLNREDLMFSRRPVWIQTYQSSMKYWWVGIKLTFVDLLEHFIMDSSVLSQLMTLSLSRAVFIGKPNTRIDIQLINKHEECVLGIWRLGQTGEAPAEHWLSQCTKTFWICRINKDWR